MEQSGKILDTSLKKPDLVSIKKRKIALQQGFGVGGKNVSSVVNKIYTFFWEMIAPQRRLKRKNGSS